MAMDSGVGRNPRGIFFLIPLTVGKQQLLMVGCFRCGYINHPQMSPVTNSCRGGPNHGLHLICQSSISAMAKCMEKSIGCLGREFNGNLGNFGQLHTTHRYHSQPFQRKRTESRLSLLALRSIRCPSHKLSSKIISKPTGYSHLPPSIQSAKGLIKSLAPLTISFLSDLDLHVK